MAPAACTWCNVPPMPELGTVEFETCNRCHQVSYCSISCEQLDYKSHNLVCQQYVNFIMSKARPSKLHRIALLLPNNKMKPELVWIDFKPHLGYDGADSYGDAIVEPHMGPVGADGNIYTKRHEISRRLRQANPDMERFHLDHSVVLYVRENWAGDGSPVNICVKEMMKGNKVLQWRGPMLAFSLPATDFDAPFFNDFRLSDLRVVMDFIRWYGAPYHGTSNTSASSETINDLLTKFSRLDLLPVVPTAIQGVDISCIGDQLGLRKPAFVKVEILSTHPVFINTQPSALSLKLGLLILVYKHKNLADYALMDPSDLAIVYRDGNPYRNDNAMFMNLNVDPRSEDWGTSNPEEWEGKVGNVLVVRQDKKPISVQQVHLLARFCSRLDQDMKALKRKTAGMSRVEKFRARIDFVEKQMCAEALEKFFETVKKTKNKDGDSSWMAATSLFEA
jgi:hypothetical protein